MILPTFLLIGAPQSATTWLYENLRKHPDINIPIKEVCFFTDNFDKGIEWYSSLYDGDKSIRGDMTPHYIKLIKSRIQFAYEQMPNAKLLCMVRDPVDRAWSEIRRAIGPDATPNQITTYLNNTKGTKHEGFEPGSENSHVDRGIENWLEFYPRSVLLEIPYAEISTNSRDVVSKVLNHIGADTTLFPWRSLESDLINANPSGSMSPTIKRLLESRYK